MVDGHNMQLLVDALEGSRHSHDLPVIIIAKTIKGYGLPDVQDKEGFHGKAFSKEQLDERMRQLAVTRNQTNTQQYRLCVAAVIA